MITSTMIEEAQDAAIAALLQTSEQDYPAETPCTECLEAAIQDVMGEYDVERQSGILAIRHQVEVAVSTLTQQRMCGGCALRAAVFTGFLVGVLAARAEAEDSY